MNEIVSSCHCAKVVLHKAYLLPLRPHLRPRLHTSSFALAPLLKVHHTRLRPNLRPTWLLLVALLGYKETRPDDLASRSELACSECDWK